MKDIIICFRKIMCNSGKAPPTQGEGVWGGAFSKEFMHS
jgi:hypothetical protein